MTESHDTVLHPSEFEELFAEILRYLSAVELFRHEGHEPSWRVEGTHTEVHR